MKLEAGPLGCDHQTGAPIAASQTRTSQGTPCLLPGGTHLSATTPSRGQTNEASLMLQLDLPSNKQVTYLGHSDVSLSGTFHCQNK